ncbi:hypothetical protein FHR24_001627 [Wenyingzhuangia heitensis]|uniref:Uncharacterized protein n=1 Tax=Wenyingzhuangia heitensis TaxID=1487859 RepID=A0ABX0U8W4_9FLAO|nr:hypothetical protein [Wenyingzhuangia heitensis]NIJ45188.1 hypothetical protein [Wenyingzhuangia heitensis]
MILRASKFFGFCYADEIAEREFFAKNFNVSFKDNTAIFSFEFMRGLDIDIIKLNSTNFTFFEIEDVYLKNKLISFLTEFPQTKKLILTIQGMEKSIKHLKLTHKGFVIKLV